jgi:hypothetical protein
MKKVFILLFILIISYNSSFSQCYTILSVKGEIKLEKTGQQVKEMDEICATDKLIFGSSDSKAAVFSSEKGRFIVKPDKKQKNSLVAYVSSVLFPGKERLSTKIILFDDEELENLKFLENEFGKNYFVIRESKVYADEKYFPMNEHNYFYLSYTYDGKEIESKLKYDKNLFLINKDVFKQDEFVINPESVETVNLYYFDREKSKRINITSFKLAFADEEKVKSEISNYLTFLKKEDKPYYVVLDEVMNFLDDVYGNVNGNDVQAYLKDTFGVQ